MNFSRSRGLVAFKVEYGRMKGRSSPLYAPVQSSLVLFVTCYLRDWKVLLDRTEAVVADVLKAGDNFGKGKLSSQTAYETNPFAVRRQKVCQSIDHLVIVLRKRLCPIRGSINNLFRKKFQYLFKVKGEGGSPNKILQHQLVITYRPMGTFSFSGSF